MPMARSIPLGQRDLGRIDLAPFPGFVNSANDRQVLDRQAGRVEERDLFGVPATDRAAGDDGADLGHVDPSHATGRDRGGQLATAAGLLPLVAEEATVAQRLRLDFCFSSAVGAEYGQVLSR